MTLLDIGLPLSLLVHQHVQCIKLLPFLLLLLAPQALRYLSPDLLLPLLFLLRFLSLPEQTAVLALEPFDHRPRPFIPPLLGPLCQQEHRLLTLNLLDIRMGQLLPLR